MNMPDRSVVDRIRHLPIWTSNIKMQTLKGGLSNESLMVDDDGLRYVVRIGSDYPFHHVFRDRELMTARAAADAGFAPEILYSEPGLTVTAFIEGVTFDEAAVRENHERIAQLIRRFHEKMPHFVSGPGFMFWPFHVIRDYARTLDNARAADSDRLRRYLKLADELEAAQIPLPIVFGHNDLLPANFIDDGKKLWLIDYEYAGFSTAMFDLAGIASNALFGEEQDEALLRGYYGGKPNEAALRSHAAMKCASLLRETMWSMISELHLKTPGVDFAAYTAENRARLNAALESYGSRFGKVQAL